MKNTNRKAGIIILLVTIIGGIVATNWAYNHFSTSYYEPSIILLAIFVGVPSAFIVFIICCILSGSNDKDNQHNIQNEAESKKKPEEIIQFEEEKRKSEIRGVDKYIEKLRNQNYVDELMIKVTQGSATLNQHLYSKKNDPAIAGGIATGIAGPIAGVATAVSTSIKNEQIDRINKEVSAHNEALNLDATRESNSYRNCIEQRNRKIEEMKNTIKIENICELEKFEKVEFEFLSYHITPLGNMKIKIISNVKEKFKILDSEAILDGSAKIGIYEGDKYVGEGYYCATGWEGEDFENIGFASRKLIEIVGCPINNELFKEGTEYRFKAEPIHMWLVEGKNTNYIEGENDEIVKAILKTLDEAEDCCTIDDIIYYNNELENVSYNELHKILEELSERKYLNSAKGKLGLGPYYVINSDMYDFVSINYLNKNIEIDNLELEK